MTSAHTENEGRVIDMARYIDVDNLIDYLTRPTGQAATCDGCCDVDCVECIVDEVIKNLPTADVEEVRHGEWKPTDPDSDVLFFCGECETEISTSWDYDNPEMWNYCPHCGAKMDGKENKQ